MKETHTERLFNYLLKGHRITDHEGYAKIRVPNIRSRVCTIEKNYDVFVCRARKVPHRYNEYWFSDPTIKRLTK